MLSFIPRRVVGARIFAASGARCVRVSNCGRKRHWTSSLSLSSQLPYSLVVRDHSTSVRFQQLLLLTPNMSIDAETDKLLAELGISADFGGGSASASVSVGGAPPPPPPPPPPYSSGGSASASIKLKTKDARDAQKEIDDIFDSVISFAGKKKAPPPVAPKPKRNVHVSTISMQVKGKDAVTPAAKPSAVPANPPPPPARASTTSVASASIAKPPAPSKPISQQQQPVALVAFGPGLETFEVNCFGDFQVSCPPDVDEDELDVSVMGPTGSKPVDITSHGNGQFSCSYQPTAAGEHVVAVKVRDEHIPGSPFKANVKFAAYTDKCWASGPGLESATTTEPARFQIRTKDDAGYARVHIHVLGPSRAEPIEMTENSAEKCVDVVYNPSAPGEYELRILWGDAHVRGSPFKVNVTGESINDATKVKVTGAGLSGGRVGETLKFFVEGEAGSGPGPLGVRIVGPSKPAIVADDSSTEGVEISYTCQDPGEYQLTLKWGDQELPMSPHSFTITGEGRAINPLLCTATGPGISGGVVGQPAQFTVNVPDEAGPGTLSISVLGPHPPKPIEIVNNGDNTMSVKYHPHAPGEYSIEVYWADRHIGGSPFKASVSGTASRNAKLVFATGEPITDGKMKRKQLGTINVIPQDGSGPGPLRAKLEGPTRGALELSNNQDGTILVSFLPNDPGQYKLHLLWGEDVDDPSSEINGSPFTINVA